MKGVVHSTGEALAALLDDVESDRVERKRSFRNDKDAARQAVCAFANDLPNHDLPGFLFIGAEDDGEPSHLPITDELLRQLSDMKTDGNILPLPVFTVEKHVLKGGEMAVVTIMPSDMPPVRFKGQIWIRSGPRRAVANAQEERILTERRRHKDLPFDIYPVSRAKLDDLSRIFFENEYLPAVFSRDVLEANNRSYKERLASCRMIVLPEDATPTILGILALGKNPQDYIPGAYIQFLRIDGTELSDPVIDEEEIKGSLLDSIRRTEEKLKAHNHTAVDMSRGPQIATMDYPHAAFQQILYNAVMHRSYEGTNAPVRVYWFNDRVEVNSPGGPFGNVTGENFGRPGITDYRNPNVADMFKTFGFVQKYGVGIQIAREAMERNGNPPPEFETGQSIVLCTLRARV
ncbi:MAG: putative DNA binding domain-containing protein [Treponema sp.]|nr:putative DNA binding domain-containing protein [Treponema sp.]